MQNRKHKVHITKVKKGTFIKIDGPVAIEIKDVNSHGQVELRFVMARDTFIDKKVPLKEEEELG